jgi:hypothetical protein
MNGHKMKKAHTSQNSNKLNQMFFAIALLILWLLVYLGVH